MSLAKFYVETRGYLAEFSRAATQVRPHLAPFLSGDYADPDGDRLIEGLTLQTAALHSKLADQQQQLVQSYASVLMPGYQRQTPAMVIAEITGKPDTTYGSSRISKGALFSSRPLYKPSDPRRHPYAQSDATPVCQFTTSREVCLLPLTLRDAVAQRTSARTTLELTFDTHHLISLEQLPLALLRFYLGHEIYSGQQLYLALNTQCLGGELQVNGKCLPLPDLRFKPVGFTREEGLLPWPNNTNIGYRLLLEYFSLPEGLLFLDVAGLPPLPSEPCNQFTLRLFLSRPLPDDVQVRRDNFRLHCTPAINLFPRFASAIQLVPGQSEYPLHVSQTHPEHYEIFSVDQVTGWHAQDKTPLNYAQFASFHHQFNSGVGQSSRYYQLHSRPTAWDQGFEHSIAFFHNDLHLTPQEQEYVHIALTCSNRELPTELQIGDIDQAGEGIPHSATIRNITRPTCPLYPQQNNHNSWDISTAIAMNYHSLLGEEILIQLLRTWDLPAQNDSQMAHIARQRLSGIEAIHNRPATAPYRHTLVRGLESELYLRQQDAFQCEGDLYLFSSVLAHFFALSASVNSFHRLAVINSSNQERYTWSIHLT